MEYGKLDESGKLTYAPKKVIYNGCEVHNPGGEVLTALGYVPVVTDNRPADKVGVNYTPSGWGQRDGAIYRTYTQEADPVTYRAWTPLTILRGAKSGGFWTAIKTTLEANDAYDEFMASQYCAECDDGFIAIKAIIVAQIGAEATETFLNGLKVEKRGTREELLEVA